MSPTGTENTRLVVLRGPSGAGKSSTARALRACLGSSLTWVAQDTIRRDILKERDVPGGANIELISIIARFALDRGWNVLIDGILHAQRYREMLDELRRDHRGISTFYYFDVSWQETVRRHASRPQAAEFSVQDMTKWYSPDDRLGFEGERIISEDFTLDMTVRRILREGLGVFPATLGAPDKP